MNSRVDWMVTTDVMEWYSCDVAVEDPIARNELPAETSKSRPQGYHLALERNHKSCLVPMTGWLCVGRLQLPWAWPPPWCFTSGWRSSMGLRTCWDGRDPSNQLKRSSVTLGGPCWNSAWKDTTYLHTLLNWRTSLPTSSIFDEQGCMDKDGRWVDDFPKWNLCRLGDFPRWNLCKLSDFPSGTSIYRLQNI